MAIVKHPAYLSKYLHTEKNINENTAKLPEALKESLIFQVAPVKERGEMISKLITSTSCVYENAFVNEVADAISHDEEIFAVAVVDSTLHPKGIILRKDLFDILGKPYCRDAYHRKHINKLMKKAEIFQDNNSIFTVIDHVSSELQKPSNTFYLVVDSTGKIQGIVSTRRILGYLSDITQRDIHLAKKVQTSIVKEQTHINRDCFELLAVSRMAKEVGGDFYYIREYKPGRWIIAICDVSGKGISASLITTALSGIFSTFDFNRGIKSFVNNVNQFFIETFYMEKYATAVIMELYEETGELLLCDMGHKQVFIERNGQIIRLHTNDINLPIGIIPEQDVVFNRLHLKKDETIMLMTDGLCEQRNTSGKEYQINRFANITKKESKNGLSAIRDMILYDLNHFKGDRSQGDDITLLMIRYKGIIKADEIIPSFRIYHEHAIENAII